jgi:hypothetical protein
VGFKDRLSELLGRDDRVGAERRRLDEGTIDMRNNRIGAATRIAAPLMAVLVGPMLAACGGGGSVSTGTTSTGAPPTQHSPVATTAADWKPVTDILGRTGKLGDKDTTYRIALPRTDLAVVTQNVPIKPGLALGGYAVFAKYDDGVMLMADLVVTEAEVANVTDALQAHGIAQTALHKHLLEQSPPVWWTHVHAMGDPAQLAQGLKAALDATAIPAAVPPPAQQPPIDLDTAGIDAALGRNGTADNGIYKFALARRDTITDDGHVVPPGFGVTTTINFQPVGAGQAAINGDFVMTAPEVQNVFRALRKGGIAIVELHNHSLTDNPGLFYLHYWAVQDGVTLAKTLRTALDTTNLQPAG